MIKPKTETMPTTVKGINKLLKRLHGLPANHHYLHSAGSLKEGSIVTDRAGVRKYTVGKAGNLIRLKS